MSHEIANLGPRRDGSELAMGIGTFDEVGVEVTNCSERRPEDFGAQGPLDNVTARRVQIGSRRRVSSNLLGMIEVMLVMSSSTATYRDGHCKSVAAPAGKADTQLIIEPLWGHVG